VSLTPLAKEENLCCKFVAGIVDTGGKFATGVNNTRGTAAKFAASVIIKIYCHINLSFDTRSTGYGMKKGYPALIIGWKNRYRVCGILFNVILIISSPPYIIIK